MTKKAFKLAPHFDTVPGTCGVGVICDYEAANPKDIWSQKEFDKRNLDGGTGYELAGFIHTAVCKNTYAYLKARLQIIFQSEVRLNSNSDNQFFFIIFDSTIDKVDNSEYDWPEFTQEEMEKGGEGW